MSVRLKRKQGHVSSTGVARSLPTLLRLSAVKDPKWNEGARAETSRLLPDPTKLLVHGDVAIAASKEFGSEG